MKTSLRFAVLAALAVVALTGCVRVQIDLTLTPDETVNGTMVLALQEGIGDLLDTTDTEAVNTLFGDTAASFDGAAVTDYAQDGYVGQKVTFEDQPMGTFALDAGDFTVSRDGANYVVNGPVDPTVAANGANIPDSAQMRLSVTFPGPVLEHNGSLEGRTVTWDLTRAPAEIHAIGAAEATNETPGWLYATIGGALLLAVAIVLIVALRRRGLPSSARQASGTRPVTARQHIGPQPTISPTSNEKTRP